MDNLLFILNTLKKHPEFVQYIYEEEIACEVDKLYFTIKPCCSNSGCIITFEDNSIVDFGANDEVLQLLQDIKEASKKYRFNLLMTSLSKYDNTSNSTNYSRDW